MSQHTTPTGEPATAQTVIGAAFGPTTDAALAAADSASQTIRDAIEAGLNRHEMLYIFPRDPPARAIAWGALQQPRYIKCPDSVLADLDTLVEQGLGQNRAHAIRILVREHLEVTVDGDE
jgi:hypothetical protein